MPDYTKMTDDEIRSELGSRGSFLDGTKTQMIERLVRLDEMKSQRQANSAFGALARRDRNETPAQPPALQVPHNSFNFASTQRLPAKSPVALPESMNAGMMPGLFGQSTPNLFQKQEVPSNATIKNSAPTLFGQQKQQSGVFGMSVVDEKRTSFSISGQGQVPSQLFAKAPITDDYRKEVRVNMEEALSLGRTVVTINVGSEDRKRTFTIHQTLLSSNSKLSETNLDDGQRTELEEINLPDDDPEAFSLYQQWLYTGRLPSKPNQSKGAGLQEEYVVLTKFYILGESLGDVGAKNVAIQALLNCWREASTTIFDHLPNVEVISIMYNGTTEADKGRKLMVDLYTFAFGGHGSLQGDTKSFPLAFLNSLVPRMLQIRSAPSSNRMITCNVEEYQECIRKPTRLDDASLPDDSDWDDNGEPV